MKRAEAELVVAGTRVQPGTRVRLELPVARLTTGGWVSLPVEVVRGAREGPALWLSGAIHGDELDGVEIIRRVLSRLRPPDLAGVVYAVPVVNVFGFISESRYLPDRRDLNRSFPGSGRGSMASRLAHLFMTEIVALCDWGLDFHCGSDGRENLPQIRANLDDDETRRLARAFGVSAVVHSKPPDGSLRKAAVAEEARVLVYEGGEAGRFSPGAIRSGVRGVFHALRALDMIERGDSAPPPEPELEVRNSHWLRAGRSGICRIDADLGQRVAKGERVAVIADALGNDERVARSRWDGVVIGRRVNPVVYQGEALVHVAEA